MSATDPADEATYLLGLPPAVQSQLARIARVAEEMTDGDRGHAAALFATVGAHFGLGNGSDDYLPGAHMVSALGVLIRGVHDAAHQTGD